ncbi:MAG TPA: hypothetical protein ENH32_08475 [Proteobacteria bacterium]|nr:hypothetical protein BMS3Abin14_01466 [bacterium BMS3Abin14]HDL53995.1 hypothetical protein [Pseudomonadota bacterium]
MKTTSGFFSIITAVFFLVIFTAPSVSFGGETGKGSISGLETELSHIEQELNTLDKRVNSLLEDLVDPKITSASLFFSTGGQIEAIPLSLEIRMDDHPLVTRQLSEADRLLLIKGGSLEIFSDIMEPGPHNLAARCQIQTAEKPSLKVEVVSAVFRFEPRRASANFMEISLSRANRGKTGNSFDLKAKHWSREN